MNIKALIAFNAANEMANEIYRQQKAGFGADIKYSFWEEYEGHVENFERLSGESFPEKREEYLKLTEK